MTSEADKFWQTVAKGLARQSGVAPLTVAEAQKEFDALPDTKLSDTEVESIAAHVMSRNKGAIKSMENADAADAGFAERWKSKLRSELEQLFGLAGGAVQRTWEFLSLEHCPALAVEGNLAHVGDQEDTKAGRDEGKEIPVSMEIKAQLPWLDKVQIVVLDQDEASGTRRYGARVSVIELVPDTSGRLYVALIQKDGTKSGCMLSIHPSERAMPFDNDFSGDWSVLTGVLAASK